MLAALLLVASLPAEAVGLGRLTVLSALGEPFHAEIELISAHEVDPGSLSVRVASPEVYSRFNLPYGPPPAGLLVSVERGRAGPPVVKITSARYINEPFVSLLIELEWPNGRLVRNYVALLDPPPVGAAPAPQPAAGTPPAIVGAPVALPPKAARPEASRTYGPIQRGETLGLIARALKWDGVSFFQMVIGLFRGNPGAFIRENLNLVKAGEILRVPAEEEVGATPHDEAVKEFRDHLAKWQAYRDQLAGTAGTREAAKEVKDVARVSRTAPPSAPGAPPVGSLEERARILEEEAIAGEKALKEARERVAQLEKTIKDLQRLEEERGQPVPDKGAAKPVPTPEGAKPAPAPEAAKPAPTPEVAKPAPEPAKPAPAPEIAKPEPPPAKTGEQPKAPVEVSPAAAQPASDLMDFAMENLPLIGGGAAVLLLGGGLLLARRRRREAAVSGPAAGIPGGYEAALDRTAPPRLNGTAERINVIEEANVFLAHGRDAQAAKLLEEALAENPLDEEVRLKLLEIHAARKDKEAFAKSAKALHDLTGGQGANWLKVAAMGFALDPANALYKAGAPEGQAAPAESAEPETTDFDFEREPVAKPEDHAPTFDTTVVPPVPGAPVAGAGAALDMEISEPSPAESTPDISFDLPDEAASVTDLPLDEDAAQRRPEDLPAIDFNLDLPKTEEATEADAEAQPRKAAPAGAQPDVKLDLSGINLELGEEAAEGEADAGAGQKDAHWHDVQEKFELAKAYQLLGADKDSVVEILQEIIKEGDAGQRSEARKLLQSLPNANNK